VIDAPFCHGASGLVHLYGRLFSATGHPEFKRAANHWLRLTLDMRDPSDPKGGYLTWHPEKDGRHWWSEGFTLLGGTGGVALALAACLSDAEPSWDRLFMCSL
jgi:lantibiotic biosynthesis protein